jgi:hypothetical protein
LLLECKNNLWNCPNSLVHPEEALFFQVKTPADLLKSLFAKSCSVVVVVVAAAWYQAEPIKLLAGTFCVVFQ